MKKTFFTEAAYLLGIGVLALGTAFMERANFGVSMVVAPAYLLHLKISEYLPFFSFGVAEYALQAVIIIVLALILHKKKLSYLFSFVTALFYGFLLDQFMAVIALVSYDTMIFRVICYIAGMLLCATGVSLLFHTYISPEAYELFVKEMSAKLHVDINRFKTIYDCTSCVISILLSFLFFGFGHFEGVKWGTVICAILNGWFIGRITILCEKIFEFRDGLSFRKYFEN